ncbi:MAG: condensation domain-containing protein [Candidatus Sulfotelmatobacter sp.]
MQRAGSPSAPSDSPEKLSPRESPVALSLAQEEVWQLDQAVGKIAPLHNESITIHKRGACDPAILKRSLDEIVRRHEIWRTTYDEVEGRVVQIVHPAANSFELPVSDLRSLPEGDRESTAVTLATQDACVPFDLKMGPLFRVRLITLRDDEHRIYLTAHQSIVDGITVFDIFPTELATLYENFAQGKPSPLPDLKAQFADFACWQRRKLAGGSKETQLKYWERQLAGELPVLKWPAERPPQQTYRGAMYGFQWPREFATSLKDLGRREGATLFMLLLAGLFLLLNRYTGQKDLIVGTLSPSGRKQSMFQGCIGYFLNPVALRANLSGNPSFQSLLSQMREVTLGAISNDDVPLSMIAERLGVRPDRRRHSFFTVALSVAPDVAPLPPGWSMTYMDVESGGARWDLYIEFSDRVDALLGRAQYNPDLFTPTTVTQTIEDYRHLLEEVLASREQ